MGREYFCCYHSYLDSIQPLDYEEIGRLFEALLIYSKTGEIIELEGNERFIFPTIKAQMDRDRQKYLDKCKKNQENIAKRYE